LNLSINGIGLSDDTAKDVGGVLKRLLLPLAEWFPPISPIFTTPVDKPAKKSAC
jgi:hypothetical protein